MSEPGSRVPDYSKLISMRRCMYHRLDDVLVTYTEAAKANAEVWEVGWGVVKRSVVSSPLSMYCTIYWYVP